MWILSNKARLRASVAGSYFKLIRSIIISKIVSPKLYIQKIATRRNFKQKHQYQQQKVVSFYNFYSLYVLN